MKQIHQISTSQIKTSLLTYNDIGTGCISHELFPFKSIFRLRNICASKLILKNCLPFLFIGKIHPIAEAKKRGAANRAPQLKNEPERQIQSRKMEMGEREEKVLPHSWFAPSADGGGEGAFE
ncbi:hypothetical protein CEXT_157911, partial [Caerostris extrusa]